MDMSPHAYFALSLLLGAITVAAFVPRIYGALGVVMSFAALVLLFFIPQFTFLGLAATALAYYSGSLAQPLGQLGLAIHVACWSVLVGYLWRVSQALPLLDGAIVTDDDQPFSHRLTDDQRNRLRPGRISWRPSLTYRIPAMLDVEVHRGVPFRTVGGKRLLLDVYRGRDADPTRPALVYIHGGGWLIGTRRQSRFMLYELAAAGWTVFAISYRFAPRNPLPAAVEDAKAGLAWVREHATEYGADGDRIVVLGGSAGGHLAALLALTPNVARFQPGFEEADTRVHGAVVLYGVSDLAGVFDERPHRGMAFYLERVVLRRRYRDAAELYHALSPVRWASREAPPMLLVHGIHDHVVPIRESRLFAEKLRQAGAPTVHLLEVPLGPHAFEVFPSPLHQRAVRVIVRFLETLR
jgi:acetyl esterase/lipase